MLDANGNAVVAIGQWNAGMSGVIALALALFLAAVVTASKYRE